MRSSDEREPAKGWRTDSSDLGQEMHRLMGRLYPICRSLTGDGVRDTLAILQEYIPLKVRTVPSGTPVFDWTIPKEWNIKDAYIKNSQGEKVVDFRDCNLHVLNYSVPVTQKLSLDELKTHLFTLPNHPDWIPYRTSYYKENWGFCLSHNHLAALPDGDYEAVIESSLKDGELTYGEILLPGKTADKVLISTHICHPSLANDNLSGISLAVFLARALQNQSRRYTYHFLFIPGCIGSIAWLNLNEQNVDRIKHGLILAGVGDSGKVNYKKSRRGTAEIDRAVAQVLKDSGDLHTIFNFSPYGYDERQFCSPAFNLPVGCFMRTPHGEYPEYHTSADNLDFVKPACLTDSFNKCLSVFDVLEHNSSYVNQNPKCEPQLGKRGLYGSVGGAADGMISELGMLWVLNYSDGEHSLLDIAAMSGLSFALLKEAASRLSEKGLLARVD